MNFRVVWLLCGMAPLALPQAKIYIEPQGGFESYISAAFFKKHVPAAIANSKESGTLVLKSGAFATQEEKSGLGKLARCAYALCIGIDGSQTVSVELRDAISDQLVWAYSVRKVGTVNYQSSAEAIAKHLKEFLEQKPPKAPRKSP
jgi:hypothetical protein